MDQKIDAAQRKTGVVVINAGNGKGKSSSGFGMVMRAMGHGMQVGVVQFIKGAMSTGEEIFLRRFPEEVSFMPWAKVIPGRPKTASVILKKPSLPGKSPRVFA